MVERRGSRDTPVVGDGAGHVITLTELPPLIHIGPIVQVAEHDTGAIEPRILVEVRVEDEGLSHNGLLLLPPVLTVVAVGPCGIAVEGRYTLTLKQNAVNSRLKLRGRQKLPVED